MSGAPFQHSALLSDAGVEHGFGMRSSEQAAPRDVALARQVHGRRVLRVPPDPSGEEADALFSRRAGVAVGVRTADCVPLLLADSRGEAVLAVHAGWRGSAARVTEVAVRAFSSACALDPADLVCAIGPHIGACCYEVDAPVRMALADSQAFAPAARDGHWLLDLSAVNREQLLSAGVRADRIERVGACTACHPELYASFRRDRDGGRMVHWARVSSLTLPAPDVPSQTRTGHS